MNTFLDMEWTIPAAALVLVIGAFYVRFLARLGARHRWGLLAAGALYLGGVLGVEFFTGPEFFKFNMDTMQYAAMTAFEEGLEMLGILLLVRTLLVYMAEFGDPVVEVHVPPARGPGAAP